MAVVEYSREKPSNHHAGSNQHEDVFTGGPVHFPEIRKTDYHAGSSGQGVEHEVEGDGHKSGLKPEICYTLFKSLLVLRKSELLFFLYDVLFFHPDLRLENSCYEVACAVYEEKRRYSYLVIEISRKRRHDHEKRLHGAGDGICLTHVPFCDKKWIKAVVSHRVNA